MAMSAGTADLCDAHDDLFVCRTPFLTWGRRRAMEGAVRTVSCFEDISLIRQVLQQDGQGAILVVDGSGSLTRALFGDVMATRAISNGWGGVIDSWGMPDAFDPRPPQELLAFYDRFSARFRAPGVCLRGYRLRWIAFRSEDLDRGTERAVLDLAWGDESVTAQAEFVACAREEVQEGCSLTFVEVGLRRSLLCGNGEPLAPATVRLCISMWRTDHPCGLIGRIEVDAEGRPTGSAQAPLPLVRMGG
jgi:hypothetical protein